MNKNNLTYLLPMQQPPAHRLEVLAAELTYNVRWAALGSSVGSAFDPRRHAFDFVLDERLPVFAVDIATPAIEVSGVVELMALHILLIVEGLEAAFLVAWYGFYGLEGNGHSVEFDCGKFL